MTGRNLLSSLALLVVLALAGCSTVTFNGPATTPAVPTPAPTQPLPTPTPKPAPKPELTFTGGDYNVWEMTWPGGTPQQWTTDGKYNKVEYNSLAWSPGGSRLAVLRLTGPQNNPTSRQLVIFSATGQKLGSYTLADQPYNTPFAWSPDGKLIAYRVSLSKQYPGTNDIEGRLVILNAQTGVVKQTLIFDNGGFGCGGAGFPPVVLAIEYSHWAYQGVDTFAWSPDGKSILVSRGCGNDAASLVNLNTQKTISGYPAGATYQPGSNPAILGVQFNSGPGGTLELTDANGNQQKVLLTDTPPSGSYHYDIYLGQSAWSYDGQTVYFEHSNGIWAVGADGSNAHSVIPGGQDDSQQHVEIYMLPMPSPDGTLLLYQHILGSDMGGDTQPAVEDWFIANADGSNATSLGQGATWVTWRP